MMENGYDGKFAEKFSGLAISNAADTIRSSNANHNHQDDSSLFQVMKAVEAAEATIKQQVEENLRLRTELQHKILELDRFKLDESMAQRSPSVDPWSEGLQTSFQAHQPVPTVDGQDNRIKSVRNTYVVLHQESQNPTTDAPIQSHAETQSNNGTINGTMKLPTDNAGSSHLSSPSTTSFSPGRFNTVGEYDPRFNFSGQGLMPMAELNTPSSLWKQDLSVKIHEHEEEIMQLRKHLANYSIKEAQIRNEKYVLEKRIAYMRLAFDQQQQDLVDAASKALSYRQDIIEENIRLTYALQDAQQERSTFVSSLLPLLAEYSLQPPVPDAQSIVSNVKVLFKHLQEKLLLTETKLKESQYQLGPWRSDSNHSNIAPQSPSHSIGAALATSNKNGLELVPQPIYSHETVPVSTSDAQTTTEWDLLGRHQSGLGGVVTNNMKANGLGRYSPIESRTSAAQDVPTQLAVTQGDAQVTRYSEETTNKQVTFRDPVRNSESDYQDPEGNHNERETSANWNSGNAPYTTALDDPSSSYAHYLPPVLEEPSSSFSEAADDDPLPAIDGLQISGEAFPGRELQACGYSINGTTSCNFEWVRHREDGSVYYIDGAKQPNYLVTADDVETYLAIEVQPLDNRKRKGELVKVFANEHKKITCDPEQRCSRDQQKLSFIFSIRFIGSKREREREREREMKMSTGFFLLLLCASLVHAQRRIDFVSIDCGSPSKTYEDTDTNITYSPDGDYTDTGINQNISSEYMYPKYPNLPFPLSDLRSFPLGNKNCYTLRPEAGKGSLNLIRASFLYGNYNGENKLPEFDLYLDVNFWSTVRFGNASEIVTKEIIGFAQSDSMHICLVNKGLGTPFISALEFRPLNSSTYGTEYGTTASLVLFRRLDIGSSNGTGRYGDDVYDRIWSLYVSPSWNTVSTSLPINTYENGYRAPFEVIKTAARPQNGSEPLNLYWNTTGMDDQFYIYMYFAEVEILARNQSRKFNISWNGSPLFGPVVPRYLQADIISNSRALVGKDHQISIYKAENSTLPPILNAIEVFKVMQRVESPTFSEDVEAITNVKTTYQIKKIWAGDPCGPKNFSWEGLKCNYTLSHPRITSLNLNSSNLNGIIAASIAKLSSLESLDLSNNNLTGPVPQFLEELKSLKILNLKGNQLSGSIPNALLERSGAGLLELSVDSQNLCGSDSCKKKKKIVVPIVASLLSALVLLIVVIVVWKLRRKRKADTERENFNKTGRTIASKKCQFTHEEVLEITKNFQTAIGKGGFGIVYHGYMKDGTQVAVKMLSPSSSQGPREFQTEAELLMRIHHRNLASFVGYCDDADNLALIYEYMPNGNLRGCLSDSDRSTRMTWEMRLRIAIDAAQGLEYLHHGCKPPIVHRDVKTANILLSENLEAKIADFGLSKVFPSDNEPDVVTTVMGTAGYLDPEYYNCQRLNEKSDVYSFGVVLLELITGQAAIIKSDEHVHIVEWVNPELQRGDITSVVDPRMQEGYDVNSVWKALEVAMACTTSTSQHRATMDFVLSELKHCLEMELSRHRERTPGSTEELRVRFAPYASTSSTEVFSMYTDSTNAESMTGPFPR